MTHGDSESFSVSSSHIPSLAYIGRSIFASALTTYSIKSSWTSDNEGSNGSVSDKAYYQGRALS